MLLLAWSDFMPAEQRLDDESTEVSSSEASLAPTPTGCRSDPDGLSHSGLDCRVDFTS